MKRAGLIFIKLRLLVGGGLKTKLGYVGGRGHVGRKRGADVVGLFNGKGGS